MHSMTHSFLFEVVGLRKLERTSAPVESRKDHPLGVIELVRLEVAVPSYS